MRIFNLIENTEGREGCEYAHGLSFYIETKKHKLLMDVGPSEVTLRNARRMGIDLSQVDSLILSHGHYDHSGGILPFCQVNPRAKIYMQKKATGPYYADDGAMAEGDRYRYIGIDPEIAGLAQVEFLEGDAELDSELSLFTMKERTHDLPSSNARLLIRQGEDFVRDDFAHEQYLRIVEDDRAVLISGCAHNGILSILDQYKEKYGDYPDLVISGFHLMKKRDYRENEIKEVEEIARELKNYPCQFVTCHCTGLPAYEIMKNILGKRLNYVHSGDEIIRD
ncbi:MAG: MBL fold metallo-hydrolase [Eubacterium sp.]|nr:MBL fold metallo-hydrolase [Eubacterium sp.]